MSEPPPTPTLPITHPLILELSSLRAQLSQYQYASHQTGIQLQSARLELALAKESEQGLLKRIEGLQKEVDVLRANPAPPPIPPTSTALTELSLAHRRLSSKLDFAESQLAENSLQLAQAQQEIQRLLKEREGDRAVINELQRVEDEREEEIEWERSERRKVEEQKKLVDLALREYKELVRKLDPSAVPPTVPTTSSSAFFTPSLVKSKAENESDPTTRSTALPSAANEASPSETISNLLIGQRGVHQLFNDFSTTLTAKDRQIASLQTHLESLEFSLTSMKDQLAAETLKRVEAEEEKSKAERDDKSAAMVVERYMTFTQKTHATVHMHLDNLRTRSNATITSLRGELATYKTRLADERERSIKLRNALDELSEGMSRESAGRRREVALRLKMIAQEEKRARKIESWLDHVRRMREGIDGAVLEADILESLVDEGIEAVREGGTEDVTPDKQRSWRGIVLSLGKKKKKETHDVKSEERDLAEESLARTLLAEELVTTLVQDLQAETEKRMDLERQRVEWLAKEAAEGVKAEEEGDGQIMFDLEDHTTPDIRPSEIFEEKVEEVPAQPEKESSAEQPVQQPTHFVSELHILFEPLTVRYTPLQKTLHDLAISLASLRASMPTSTPLTPTIRHGGKKSTFLPLARLPTPVSPLSREMSTRATLSTLFDALHEVIEDARVDVEIALADTERVHRGFEALLNVIPGQGKDGEQEQVMGEVHEYVTAKGDGEEWKRLNRKVEDIERDLAGLKRVVHEMEGMQIAQAEEEGEDEGNKKGKGGKDKEDNIWRGVHLKTISLQPRHPSPLPTPLVSPLDDLTTQFSFTPNGSSTPDGVEPRRRTASMLSSVGHVGRSFSAGVMGAPRRVSGLASGLYRAPGKDRDDKLKEELLKGTDKIEEDDVE
ncbi:hypothetical protein C361_00768 [Cryptococcus neoformans Tu259-1]|uniref:Uncharacterized protein n=1 Tax=Cryptococcus neoformans Tu259-1 TaxID=1230072 RepID=A0A854QI29_CRYNE|nr:hypothetical protein C353_00775 [Cryptococcus neoformans var. grubii AD1-83a]OXG29112.1 hypothetical protein C361_00768 [Cryptococcus neoformans var. grubii Tu259-1]OXG68444.1 hypothetical protein C351_00776 [Cryptococcus neoformans var. grubii c8]OXG69006.1 hypothetical protein C354_00778 [Cryptococcus neoformans var. grubii MW-RSA1955]OXG72331.1 hypothetical protein C352_00773 [Cryptococcus neoformans var. grubii CHC193]OXH18230.1 hypothetical protein C369_00773 [Cryptococcus neoformans v